MSSNYALYAVKMAELRARRAADRTLRGQLDELLRFVMICEARWDQSREPR